jgi:hypothetical protein
LFQFEKCGIISTLFEKLDYLSQGNYDSIGLLSTAAFNRGIFFVHDFTILAIYVYRVESKV